jgi:hypothetical protein
LSEPVTYSTPQSIKSIRLEATNPGGGKVIGVIEVSARWIKDLSSDIEVITISKESSSSSSDIIPIGYVTANSINLNVSKYDKTTLQIQPYNRYSSSFDSSLIYAVKNAELKEVIRKEKMYIYIEGKEPVARKSKSKGACARPAQSAIPRSIAKPLTPTRIGE